MIGNRAGLLWSKVSRGHSLLLISGPFDTNTVDNVPASRKRAVNAKTKPVPVAAKPASPRRLHLTWAKPMTAREPSPVLEVEELSGGDSDWGRSIDKGKDGLGTGVKRKSTGDTTVVLPRLD